MQKGLFRLLLLIVLMSTGSKLIAQEASELRSFIHNDIERSYRLYVPENGADKLLMVLHAVGANARSMEIFTDFNRAADEYGFAVVYPQANSIYWNAARSDNGRLIESPVDDTGFLLALADSITAEYNINRDEVYLTGHNNGGEMAFVTACTMPERFAGVAVVSALRWNYQADACPEESDSPLNTLIIWGDSNPAYPGTESGSTSGEIRLLSTQQTLDFWLNHNSCADGTTNPHPNIEHFACAGDTTTTLVTVQGGGHNWYGVREGDINQPGIDATELVSRFIMQSDNWLEAGEQAEIPAETARSWIVYVPDSYNPNIPAPLVMLLHGRTVTAENQVAGSAFNLVAEREGIIAVYPQGLNKEWSYTRPADPSIPTDLPDDDTFIRSLLDELAQDLNIDNNRVYVTGISNGGFMAQRLACTLQDRFVAFASVAATGAFRLPNLCEGKESVPALYIHGTADAIVPWDGTTMPDGRGGEIIVSASMAQTIGFWAEHNACGNDLDIVDIPATTEETQTRILSVTGCPGNADVVVYMVINGGHTWHGVSRSSDIPGLSSQDFNASEEIWEFFNQFSHE